MFYTVVLVLTGLRYPTFYDDYWNLPALSGVRIWCTAGGVSLRVHAGHLLVAALRGMEE